MELSSTVRASELCKWSYRKSRISQIDGLPRPTGTEFVTDLYHKVWLLSESVTFIGKCDFYVTGFTESYYDFKESFKYHIIYMYNVFR